MDTPPIDLRRLLLEGRPLAPRRSEGRIDIGIDAGKDAPELILSVLPGEIRLSSPFPEISFDLGREGDGSFPPRLGQRLVPLILAQLTPRVDGLEKWRKSAIGPIF